MKRLWILLASILLAIASMPETGWAQTSTGISLSGNLLPDSLKSNVLSLYVDTNGDIFAAMSQKALLRSKDDGKRWERIFNKDFLSNFGFAVIREPKTNALLFGNGRGLYRSTSEGNEWALILGDWANCFLTKPNGSILVGMGGRIAESSDGGTTWKDIFSDPGHFNILEFAMSSKTNSLFAATADTLGFGILRSTDDGTTWHQSNVGISDLHVWSVASDSNGIVYAGTENGLYRSADDGMSWTRITEIGSARRWARKILMVKPDLVFVGFDDMGGAGGAKSGVLKYDGRTWTQIVADSVSWVGALAVKENSLLVGTWNAIYRVDGVIVGVEDEPNAIPSSFHLEQNYPNPFNPSTTIEFALSSRSHVRLSIWNVIGQEVAMLVDGEKSSGTHRIAWDASGLPSGVYFYRLETKQFIQTKKMLLMK